MLTYALMGAIMGGLGASYIRVFNATGAYFRRMALPSWEKRHSDAAGRRDRDLSARKSLRRISDHQPRDGGRVRPRDAAGASRRNMPHHVVARLGCARRSFRSDLFHRHDDGGGSVPESPALFIPHLTGPRGSYALVGLGAFLAGTTHAPLTALFLLFEMTGDFTVALPAMIAAVTALVVSRAIESESIDTYRLAREGKTLQISQERLGSRKIPQSQAP